jgi:hypothetical protein
MEFHREKRADFQRVVSLIELGNLVRNSLWLVVFVLLLGYFLRSRPSYH